MSEIATEKATLGNDDFSLPDCGVLILGKIVMVWRLQSFGFMY